MVTILLSDIGSTTPSGGFAVLGNGPFAQAGWSVSSAGDVNGDGFDDFVVGAPGFYGPYGYGGGAFVVFGDGTPPSSPPLTISNLGSAGFGIIGAYGGTDYSDRAGLSVSGAGDINGDGFADILVGAPRFPSGGISSSDTPGQAYVIFGHSGSFPFPQFQLATPLDGNNGFNIVGENVDDRAGWTVSNAGDVNGDGFKDFLVGSENADASGRDNSGKSYLVYGKDGGFGTTLNLSDIAGGTGGFAIDGAAAGDQGDPEVYGHFVSGAGDVNGDGLDDLLFSARYATAGDGVEDGKTYVVFGKTTGTNVDLATLAASDGFRISGYGGIRAGSSVADAGDINGDGFRDIIIGAPYYGGLARYGAAFVVLGQATPADVTLGGATPLITTLQSGARLGSSVSSAGDVNGDGYDDLIVGASDANKAYVIFGGSTINTTTTVDTMPIDVGFTIQGETAGDNAGWSVSSAGDLNGDGFDDLIVGAQAVNPTGDALGTSAGASYVIYGAADIDGSTSRLTQPPFTGDATPETIAGSAGPDVLVGGGESDFLDGMGGADSLRGGEGADSLAVGDASFRRIDGGNGLDNLFVFGAMTLVDTDFRKVSNIEEILLSDNAINLTLGANAQHAIEGLAASDFQIVIGTENFGVPLDSVYHIDGTALTRPMAVTLQDNAGDVTLLGGSGNDTVSLGDGNDSITGGTGIDDMSGGGGNDSFFVSPSDAAVSEVYDGGGGTDELYVQNGNVDFTGATLTSIEELGMGAAVGTSATFTSSQIGAGLLSNTLAVEGDGNQNIITVNMDTATVNLSGWTFSGWTPGASDDKVVVNGTAGNDSIRGTSQYDELKGGTGNDSYVVTTGDMIVEGVLQGALDRVFAHNSFTLNAGAAVENMSTDNHAGTGAIDLSGNELANLIYGNAGANRLDGGLGNDTMIGWGGDDTYKVNTAGDIVQEADGTGPFAGGSDTVRTSVSYALHAGSSIETFTTTDVSATTALSLTGNDVVQHITGNAGDNMIDGKAGADVMEGLGGNDWYFVDNAGDQVIETGGTGNRVFASASWTMTDGAVIEKLSTTSHAGNATIDLTGNALANAIYGNAGDNVLNGKDGNDNLTGFGGADTFVFDTALSNATNLDVVTDMTAGVDHIQLALSVFGALSGSPGGTLAASEFVASPVPVATDSDDHILYNTLTGLLDYDSNGSGLGGVTHIARLTSHPTLANTDFLLAS